MPPVVADRWRRRLRSWLPQLTGAARHPSALDRRLPVASLPAGLGALRDRQPVLLLCGDAATRLRALRAVLEPALADAPVTWLGAEVPDVLALGPTIGAAARRGRLRAMGWQPQALREVERRPEGQVLSELSSIGMRRRELLVIDGLAPWLSTVAAGEPAEGALQRAAEWVLRWARQHRGPLLVIGPSHHHARPLVPLLAASALPCLALLQAHGEQMHLEIARWTDAAQGQVWQDLAFGLVDRPDGGWQADGSGLGGPQLLTAPDIDRVLTTESLVRGATGVPAHWETHADLPALEAACRFAVAATVLLPYRTPADVAALAETVRRLRTAHPHALKIIVREVGGKLRYNHELALLRLGANAVVYREIPFSRFLQTVAEYREQLYGRPAGEVDVGGTLQAVAPDPVRGYLGAALFCRSVQRMLDRTAQVALSHCIVRLPLLGHVAHLDALLACRISRDGDLVTTDAQGLCLFLFACRAPDVSATLERLFAQPASELFSHVELCADALSIKAALQDLARDAADAVADYGAILQATPEAAVKPATDPDDVRQRELRLPPEHLPLDVKDEHGTSRPMPLDAPTPRRVVAHSLALR